MRDPIVQFQADLQMVTGQEFTAAFIKHAFEHHPEYVRETHAVAEQLRSHVKPTSTQAQRPIDQIKAKYRPMIERFRREQELARRANQD